MKECNPLTSKRAFPSFILTTPLLYTSIFPINPGGKSSRVQRFLAIAPSPLPTPFPLSASAAAAPEISDDGRDAGNWKKSILGAPPSSFHQQKLLSVGEFARSKTKLVTAKRESRGNHQAQLHSGVCATFIMLKISRSLPKLLVIQSF